MLVKAFPATLTGLGDAASDQAAAFDMAYGQFIPPDISPPPVDTSFSTAPIGSTIGLSPGYSGGSSSASSGFNWGNFLSSLIGTGANVATKAIQSGSTVITYPNGSQVVVPAGQQVPSLPNTLGISSQGLFGSSSSSGLLVIGGIALLAIVFMSQRER
jgi:hypothetical protein